MEEAMLSRLRGVKLFLVVAGVAWVALASTASAGVRGLSVGIDAAASSIGAADDAILKVTYRNDSAEDLYLLRWQTALRGVEANLFDVRRDGQTVAYTGRLYKRAAPRAEDYVRIPAGGSASAEVDLSGVYDMSRTGEYAIRYRVDLQDALRVDGRKIAGVAGLTLESNVVFLGIERDERAIAAVEALAQLEEAARGSQVKSLPPSYVSCTSSRQSLLATALDNAQSISLAARDYLNNLPVAQRPTDVAYDTWFGAYTSSRYATVQSHYTSIHSAFANQTFTFFCDCTDSSYAFVYANRPYEVHLCNAFWNAPALGIDSKAGTLVHENSHFTVVAGTQDYAYGTTACQNLANKNPKKAIANADSHEYFAETR
jgi:peptidyl-Lys metalloendopeptidase